MNITNRRLKRKAIRKFGSNLSNNLVEYLNIVKTMKYVHRFVEDVYTQSWHMQKTTKIKNSYNKSGIILIKKIDEFELRLGVDYEKYLHYFNICHKIYLQIIDKLKDDITYSSDYQRYHIRMRMPGFVLIITDKIKLITLSYEDVVIGRYTCKRWVKRKPIVSLDELTRLYPDCFRQFIGTKSAKF